MLVRLDWGGIDADDEGRQQLASAAVVIDFLLADYKALAEQTRAAGVDTDKAEKDISALYRVAEMVFSATCREREARGACDETETEETP